METLGLGEWAKGVVAPRNDECGASYSLELLNPGVLVLIKVFPLYHVHLSVPGFFVFLITEAMFPNTIGQPVWICCAQIPVT